MKSMTVDTSSSLAASMSTASCGTQDDGAGGGAAVGGSDAVVAGTVLGGGALVVDTVVAGAAVNGKVELPAAVGFGVVVGTAALAGGVPARSSPPVITRLRAMTVLTTARRAAAERVVTRRGLRAGEADGGVEECQTRVTASATTVGASATWGRRSWRMPLTVGRWPGSLVKLVLRSEPSQSGMPSRSGSPCT